MACTVGRLGGKLDSVRSSPQEDKMGSDPGHTQDDRVYANLGDEESGIELFVGGSH